MGAGEVRAVGGVYGVKRLSVLVYGISALYHAMKEMMTNHSAREMMASNARKMIADRFEQGFVRKCLYDFYDEVLASFSSAPYDELQNLNTEL